MPRPLAQHPAGTPTYPLAAFTHHVGKLHTPCWKVLYSSLGHPWGTPTPNSAASRAPLYHPGETYPCVCVFVCVSLCPHPCFGQPLLHMLAPGVPCICHWVRSVCCAGVRQCEGRAVGGAGSPGLASDIPTQPAQVCLHHGAGGPQVPQLPPAPPHHTLLPVSLHSYCNFTCTKHWLVKDRHTPSATSPAYSIGFVKPAHTLKPSSLQLGFDWLWEFSWTQAHDQQDLTLCWGVSSGVTPVVTDVLIQAHRSSEGVKGRNLASLCG